MFHTLRRNNGVTLTELLIALALTGIVTGAIYKIFISQSKEYTIQSEVAEMQQNLRAGVFMMGRDIRMAGFNPQRAPDAGGFVTQLPDDGVGETTTDSTNIAFTIDENRNGVIDLDDDDEQIAYRLDNATNTLQKFRVSDDTWHTVADNIDALDFVYLDGSRNALNDMTTPVATADLPNIRSIQVTMVARSGAVDPEYTDNNTYQNQNPGGSEVIYTAPGDNFRRRLLTTEIQCRNLGF